MGRGGNGYGRPWVDVVIGRGGHGYIIQIISKCNYVSK